MAKSAKEKHKQVDPLESPKDFADLLSEELFTEGLAANSPSELLDGTAEELWVKSRGWTPLEYLTHTYRNPWQETKDRIAAAKAVLEYCHRKVSQSVDVNVTHKKLSVDGLSKLSDSELEVFTKLLEKIGTNEKI